MTSDLIKVDTITLLETERNKQNYGTLPKNARIVVGKRGELR